MSGQRRAGGARGWATGGEGRENAPEPTTGDAGAPPEHHDGAAQPAPRHYSAAPRTESAPAAAGPLPPAASPVPPSSRTSRSSQLSRRQFVVRAAGALAPVALAPIALVGLARKAPRRLAGGFVNESAAMGHRLRDRAPFAAPTHAERVPVVIVGGGVAGLSAAWQLDRRGFRDFVLLEMEPQAGGNARWGENEVSAYPWAAHYVPVPGKGATLVRELFAELGLLDGAEWDERSLCFSPKERVFIHGRWEEGLETALAFGRQDRDELRRLAERVEELRLTGEFTIPMAAGAPRSSPLDGLSMAAWLRQEGFASGAVRWLADYACRDDYGARADDASAWAGVHYFAAREAEEAGPLTWPEGNGRIVRRLLAKLGGYLKTGATVVRVERRGSRVRVLASQARETGDSTVTEYLADAVVFAAPTFLAPYVVEGAAAPRLVYSPWLTANLTLERWPAERGAPPAWDNVIYDSPGLGYVVATHQSLRTHQERTVWTYYRALADGSPADNRRRLLASTWGDWVEVIFADLARAHPDVRDCVSRVDVMRMGHAMVRPTPGFLGAVGSLHGATALGGRLFYANSDLSGLSLFEEAQYRGVIAADRALRLVG